MLARFVPAPLVHFFAAPYVAGHTMDAALEVAASVCARRGLLSTIDLLGEDVRDPAQVAGNYGVYARLIEALATDRRFDDARARPSISVKPSAFTVEDQRSAFEPIHRLAEIARERNIALTIDMEDHRWTDVTLEHALGLYAEGFDVGTVLQSRLDRTADDVSAIPRGMRVRLVIGIYPEPSRIATRDKVEMKERLLSLAAALLERGARVEFATHDARYLERFAREVAKIAPDRCEVQMLLGVPREELQRQLLEGFFGAPLPVRLYVPFATRREDATAYLRRRMAESPTVVWAVLKNLLTRPRLRPPKTTPAGALPPTRGALGSGSHATHEERDGETERA